ncbi:carboxymuconolactone decarboxylase family protein [Aestuariivita sp.]|uniref:carboxymuconolactone decarboxylase family protein n=1 Tax=Aestuariivita sp. TaxID=1872407 RepID=UPI0025C5DB20|nr:carboxymuconolactone decarboxylase family protein [Aestuariivita sp.]
MTPQERYPATQAQRATGDWNPFWDTLAALDPDYLEAFLAFRAVPQSGPLPKKYRELIFIAINVATTHLWPSGIRRHMQNALQAGATKEEILEVIQLASIMGVHSMSMGVPILLDEVEKLAAEA